MNVTSIKKEIQRSPADVERCHRKSEPELGNENTQHRAFARHLRSSHPQSGRREKRTVRELVETRAGEKAIHREIKERVAAKVQLEAEKQESDHIDLLLAEFLKPTQTDCVVNSQPTTEKPHAVPVLTKAEERDQRRWLHALAIVADESKPEGMRLAACVRVQKGLPEVNPLKNIRAQALLKRVLPPWSERLYLEGGRSLMKLVSRPPVSLADVWD